MIITFWLAVQQSSFEFARYIYNLPDSEFIRKRWTTLILNSFKKNKIDEKFIRKFLKESDSFASEMLKVIALQIIPEQLWINLLQKIILKLLEDQRQLH